MDSTSSNTQNERPTHSRREQRLSSETLEDQERRLVSTRALRQNRRAVETAKEWETRLATRRARDRVRWRERLATDPNIEEAPSFISQQRQAAGQHIYHHSRSSQPAGEAAASVHHCPAAPLSHQSPTSEDDCLRHSWHREVLPHPLPPTSPSAPACGCSSDWCGCLQHRWPHPPLKFKDLEGERLTKLQQSFSEVKYLIIDEMSMVGRKTFGQVDLYSKVQSSLVNS